MLILIADAETGVRNSLAEFLKSDHEVILCEDGAQALAQLEKTSVDLVITDHSMPKLQGLELIKRGKVISPSTAFILMTARGSVEQAVDAIRAGADDYFMKPFELHEISHRIRRVEDLQTFKAENELKAEAGKGVSCLIGNSASIRSVKEFILKVAPVSSPVLLLGPSGSGKEVVAKAVHDSGNRFTRPFIAINCASQSEQLMESELFGHEKGAFMGATVSKPGKFELAKGGTIFLDEVGELSGALQAKLLHVLQENEFFRVGGVRQIKTDVRVIAATHRPLKEMVKSGRFREDLFYRLNVMIFELAPLAQRPEDIIPLVEFFWNKLTREIGRKVTLSPKAMQRLTDYSFPGNVRELQNVLARLIILGPHEGVIQAEGLPPEFYSLNVHHETTDSNAMMHSMGLTEHLEALEARLVKEAMAQAGHNQVKAAELLRITRGALQYKLKKYGIGHHPALQAA